MVYRKEFARGFFGARSGGCCGGDDEYFVDEFKFGCDGDNDRFLYEAFQGAQSSKMRQSRHFYDRHHRGSACTRACEH